MQEIRTTTIIAIDVLRGVLAILVLLAHSWERSRQMSAQGDLTPTLIDHLVAPGGIWVAGFFVLSGTCIALSVFRSIDRKTYSPGRYLFARFTRIYPLFLIGLALAVAVWFAHVDTTGAFPSDRLFWNALNLQYVMGGSFPQYDPSWSITCEMIYYLVFPLVLVLAGKHLGRTVVFGLAISTVAFLLAAALWIKWFDKDVSKFFWIGLSHGGLLWFLGAGVLLGFQWKRSIPRPATLVLSLIFALLGYAVRTYAHYHDLPSVVSYAGGSLFAAAVACWLVSLECGSSSSWAWLEPIAKPAKWLGLLSYPLYLLHMPLHGLIEAIFGHLKAASLSFSMLLPTLLLLPLLVAGTLGVAAERFFLNRRKSWLRVAQA